MVGVGIYLMPARYVSSLPSFVIRIFTVTHHVRREPKMDGGWIEMDGIPQNLECVCLSLFLLFSQKGKKKHTHRHTMAMMQVDNNSLVELQEVEPLVVGLHRTPSDGKCLCRHKRKKRAYVMHVCLSVCVRTLFILLFALLLAHSWLFH